MSFNRAADYYDATRGLPEQVRTALADVLAAELAGASRCLEVGVGTGRIALPLHERGVRIVGSDIAPTVLARLVANAGGVAPFPLVCADATRLPFRPAVYDAVLFCHVLHLVTDWRAAVDEARRMLRPGVSDPATVAAYLSVDAEPLPPVPMTVRRDSPRTSRHGSSSSTRGPGSTRPSRCRRSAPRFARRPPSASGRWRSRPRWSTCCGGGGSG